MDDTGASRTRLLRFLVPAATLKASSRVVVNGVEGLVPTTWIDEVEFGEEVTCEPQGKSDVYML